MRGFRGLGFGKEYTTFNERPGFARANVCITTGLFHVICTLCTVLLAAQECTHPSKFAFLLPAASQLLYAHTLGG